MEDDSRTRLGLAQDEFQWGWGESILVINKVGDFGPREVIGGAPQTAAACDGEEKKHGVQIAVSLFRAFLLLLLCLLRGLQRRL